MIRRLDPYEWETLQTDGWIVDRRLNPRWRKNILGYWVDITEDHPATLNKGDEPMYQLRINDRYEGSYGSLRAAKRKLSRFLQVAVSSYEIDAGEE